MTQNTNTGRKLKLIHAIHGFETGKAAQDAKTAMESRDDWTYHVVGAGPQRVLLGHVIDEQGREVTALCSTDDVSYCA